MHPTEVAPAAAGVLPANLKYVRGSSGAPHYRVWLMASKSSPDDVRVVPAGTGLCGAPPAPAGYSQVCGLSLKAHDVDAEIEKHKAFTEKFWSDRLGGLREPGTAICGGRFFTVGREPAANYRGPGLGFGGAHFRVEFDDGRLIDTHNLWSGGEIPLWWRGRLPDNCRIYNHAGDPLRMGGD